MPSHTCTSVLREAEVWNRMDGRGRWMDNVFIERLWQSVKYECVYLHAFETGSELRRASSAGSPDYSPIPPLPIEPRQRHMVKLAA